MDPARHRFPRGLGRARKPRSRKITSEILRNFGEWQSAWRSRKRRSIPGHHGPSGRAPRSCGSPPLRIPLCRARWHFFSRFMPRDSLSAGSSRKIISLCLMPETSIDSNRVASQKPRRHFNRNPAYFKRLEGSPSGPIKTWKGLPIVAQGRQGVRGTSFGVAQCQEAIGLKREERKAGLYSLARLRLRGNAQLPAMNLRFH